MNRFAFGASRGRSLPFVRFFGLVCAAGFACAAACSSSSNDHTSSGAPASTAPPPSWAAIPTWARAGHYVGRVDPDAPIALDVHLPLRNETDARAELAAVSDPTSARYGRFLTQADLEAKYLPTDADVAVVRAHFEAHGLRVTQVAQNRAYVHVEGTVAQAEQALATRLGNYQVTTRGKVEVRRAPIDPPSLPADVAPRVSAVLGLSSPTSIRHELHRRTAGRGNATNNFGGPCAQWYGQSLDTQDPRFAPGYPSPMSWATCGYVPAQLRQTYGFGPTTKRGITGNGQTVGLLESYVASTLVSDAQTYAANHDADYPLAASQVQIFSSPLTPVPEVPGDDATEESSLDLEAVHAMAPGADVVVELVQGYDDAHYLAALNDFVTNDRASMLSSSIDTSSEGVGSGGGNYAPYESVVIQAGLKGIGFYFVSGDGGDYVEEDLAYYGPTAAGELAPIVLFPASMPEVTAVGGTSLALGADGERLWETGWESAFSYYVPAGADGTWPYTGPVAPDDGGLEDGGDAGPLSWWPGAPGGYEFGAGGGMSVMYSRPHFQDGIVPRSIATVDGGLERVLPDVAMLADPFTGFLWGDSSSGSYVEIAVGGTSLAAPLFVGTIALAQQYAGRQFGVVNPLLYLASRNGAFRDIAPIDRKAVAFDPGVLATIDYHGPENSLGTQEGFDNVTGLGVPSGEAFFEAIAQAARVGGR